MTGDLDVAATRWLQDVVPAALRPVLDAASHAGGSVGWLVVIALSFWWSGSRLGVRVALVASASAVANVLLKWIFLAPRPYFLTDRIVALTVADGFGMPSGHAQGSAATWGATARWSGAGWVWVVGGVATLLAGVARVFYGVHGLLQVVCGWLLGALAVALAAALERPLVRWWATASPRARWSIAIVPPVMALAAGLLLRELVLSGWETPVEWVARHRATAMRLGSGWASAELRLIDAGALARWSGGLLGAASVAAWYGSAEGRALVAPSPRPPSRRHGALATAIGMPAMAAILGGGQLLVERAGAAAELARFAVVMWVIGVTVPRLAEKIDAAMSRRA